MRRHFRLVFIPAGSWSRLEGSTKTTGLDEERAHLVPLTNEAKAVLGLNRCGYIDSGLVVGYVHHEDGSRGLAFRFISPGQAWSSALIAVVLDELAEDFTPRHTLS